MCEQPEQIVLFPTTHEQENPTFHVEASLAEDFLEFLKQKGLSAWEPPQKLDKVGPDHRRIIELKLEAETPQHNLEELLEQFRSLHKLT
ncbi:hypothetical protein DB345_01280 [Spartobacteria bacterium LR76]|nr:hypothetical protein DB345_01280 [Spartobacteria bacterium LR76]